MYYTNSAPDLSLAMCTTCEAKFGILMNRVKSMDIVKHIMSFLDTIDVSYDVSTETGYPNVFLLTRRYFAMCPGHGYDSQRLYGVQPLDAITWLMSKRSQDDEYTMICLMLEMDLFDGNIETIDKIRIGY